MAAATKDKPGTDTSGLHVVGESEGDLAAIEEANAKGDSEVKADDARSVEELAEDPPEEKPLAPLQIPIPGTIERISLTAGGTAPGSSEARLIGARLPIEGQFQKGEYLDLHVKVKVGEVAFIDTTDEWGNVQKTVRAHKLRVQAITRLQS